MLWQLLGNLFLAQCVHPFLGYFGMFRAPRILVRSHKRLPPEQQAKGPTPSQQMMMMEKMRGANVQPQQNIDSEVEKGNLVPMKEQRR